MPLIILTGLPLSSKTTRSKELFKLFTSEIKTVIISEETLSLNKTNLNEKEDRQKILSKVERELSKDVLVIVDHLNYIKGFRYQLYVIARGLGTRSAVVYCASTMEKSLEINAKVKTYNDEDIKQLSQRYEEPDGRNRWDKPLFICLMEDGVIDKNSKLGNDLIEYLKGTPKPPNASTVIKPLFDSSLLSRADKVLTDILQTIIEAQKDSRLGPITVPHTKEKVILEEFVEINELRRLKRQYGVLFKSHTVVDMQELGNGFVKYLNLNI